MSFYPDKMGQHFIPVHFIQIKWVSILSLFNCIQIKWVSGDRYDDLDNYEDKDGNIISFDNDDFIIDTTYEEKILELIKVIKKNVKINKKLIKKINKEFYNNIDKLENIYSQLSTPLIKIGGFSDGTAIYEAL